MKSLLSLLFTLIAATSWAQQINDANAEPRQVGAFHAIDISSAFEVTLSQGSQGLAVSANDKEDLAQIRTEVKNGVLKIWFETKKGWWPKNRKLRAYISAQELDGISLSGASELKLENTFTAQRLRISCSGASQIRGKLAVNGKLDARLSGASDMEVSGSATDMYIDASGACRVKATGFSVSTCEVKASGASKVQIGVDKELKADLSGASTVVYSGSGVIREIKTSGASSISRKS